MKQGKIKILHAMRQGQIGGGEGHVYEMVSSLNRNEFEPIVLSFTDGPVIDKLREKKIPVYVVNTLQPFHFSTFNNVQAIIRSEDIDIVHAHGTRALSNTLFTSKSMGLPVIYTVYGWAFHRDQRFVAKKVRELSEKLLVSNVDLTIKIDMNASCGEFQLNGSDRSVAINYGVNLEKYSPYRPIRDIRNDLGLSPSKLTIGYIDKITKQKDPITFINAIAAVKNNRDQLQFIMAGDGSLTNDCKELADKLGVSEMIHFYSPSENSPELYKAIDIYCSTAVSEGLKPELMEAMAMHKTVVATYVEGTTEIVKNNVNGLLCRQRDIQQIKEAWLRLANDPALRDQLAENAYKTIHKEFDLRTIVAYNENIYRSFMQKKMTA